MATAMGPGGGSVLQVYIFRNGEFTGTDVFVEREIVIGRDATAADLLLESTSVSREHALLTISGNTLHIEDLGSTNGLLLNEEEVSEADITRFDEVGVGEFALKFKLVRKARSARKKGDGSPVVFVDEDTDTAAEDSAPQRRPVNKAGKKRRRKRPSRADSNRAEAQRRDPTPSSKGLAKGHARKARADSSGSERSPVNRRAKKKRPPQETAMDRPAKSEARKAVHPPLPPDAAKLDERERDPSFKFKEHTVLDAGASLRERLESINFGVPKALDAPIPTGADDDEDEEEASFVPAYSLVERLVEEDRIVAVQRNAQALEVLTLQGEDVIDVTLMRAGDAFWSGPKVGFLRRLTARDLKPRVRMLKLRRDGRCEVRFRKGIRGTVQRGQDTRKLKGTERRNQRGVYAANLKGGEILDLDDAPTNYHVRYVIPPPPVFDEPRLESVPAPIRPIAQMVAGLKPTPLGARSIGGSLGTHMLAFILMALVSVGQAAPAVSTADFVEVALDTEDLDLEEPEPEEKPEPEPEKKSKASEKVPPKMEAAPSKRRPRMGGTSKAAAGVLGLLSKRGSSAAPGPASAVAAVSNLSAAHAPGGGGFRVSGLIGKLPTSSLSVGGGGGGPVTKGGLALLRGGSGGAGRLAGGKGTRKVGGLVTRQPKAMKQKGQGSLDRDEIQKVINKGISQIQRCYERELLRTPGLAGKVQVEWTVATSGSVRSVRQAFASINSTAVVSCIMGKIKTWKFPRPRGGEVIINYPFIFKPVGF